MALEAELRPEWRYVCEIIGNLESKCYPLQVILIIYTACNFVQGHEGLVD